MIYEEELSQQQETYPQTKPRVNSSVEKDALMNKIVLSFDCIGKPVKEVTSGIANANPKKYSVICNDQTEFVHSFVSATNGRRYVGCQSGLCKSRFSKFRKIENLAEGSKFCEHMEQLRRDLNLDVNATSLDEDEEADFDDDDEECDLMGDFVQTGDGGNELVNEADSGIPDEKVS